MNQQHAAGTYHQVFVFQCLYLICAQLVTVVALMGVPLVVHPVDKVLPVSPDALSQRLQFSRQPPTHKNSRFSSMSCGLLQPVCKLVTAERNSAARWTAERAKLMVRCACGCMAEAPIPWSAYKTAQTWTKHMTHRLPAQPPPSLPCR